MSCDWIELASKGSALCGTEIAGLPTVNPKWVYRTVNGGFDLNSFLINKNNIYLIDGSHFIQAININNGILVWEGPKIGDLVRFVLNDPYILATPYFLDIKDGRVLSNLTEDIDIQPNRVGTLWFQEDKLYRELDYQSLPGKYLIYQCDKKKYQTIEIGLTHLRKLDSNIWVGWEKSKLVRMDLNTRKRYWVTDILNDSDSPRSAQIMYFDKFIYVTYKNIFQKLDSDSGKIIWKKDAISLSNIIEKPTRLKTAVCRDTFHFLGQAAVCAISTEDGKLLWENKLVMQQDFCIAGDLLFGIDFKRLIAWDRYSGEEVWQAEDKVDAYSVKAVDGKVLFNTLAGELYCYEWKEIYNSPAKPK